MQPSCLKTQLEFLSVGRLTTLDTYFLKRLYLHVHLDMSYKLVCDIQKVELAND